MRDPEVRAALLGRLRQQHAGDDSLILNELGLLNGTTRVDVAVVSGELSGYEIKSPSDTMVRFPKQQAHYSRILDRAWLVTTAAHASSLDLPEWWGLLILDESDDSGLTLRVEREAQRNPHIEPLAIAAMLWRAEAMKLLVARGAADGLQRQPRRAVWERVVEAYTLDELRDAVRVALKRRRRSEEPRPASAGRRVPGGATFRLVSTSPDPRGLPSR